MSDLTARTELPPATVAGRASRADVTEAPRRSGRDMGRSVIKHVLLIAGSLVMIYPVVWMLVSSLRPTDVIFRTPGLWLNDLYLDNYTKGWNALTNSFGHYMINSAIVVIGAIAGNLLSCSMAAYAFARLRFRLKGLWFSIMLV